MRDSILNKLCPYTLLQDQLHDTMLTLERVLGLYWLVMLVVQEMKEHFSSALPVLLESFTALTIMMLVLNVLVSITLTLKLYTYSVQVNIDVLFYSSLSQW